MLSHSEIESFLQEGYVIRRGVLSQTGYRNISRRCRFYPAQMPRRKGTSIPALR